MDLYLQGRFIGDFYEALWTILGEKHVIFLQGTHIQKTEIEMS